MDPGPIYRIELYPFSYYDPVRRKWMRARYVASLDDIAKRGQPFKILGKPEIREFQRDPRILSPRDGD